MKLLNPVLAKLCTECPVVLQWMVFLKTRPFVKQNNTEFTNVRSFTSLLMFCTFFTLSCRILLLALPNSKNFVQFVFAETPEKSARGVLFRPPSRWLPLWSLLFIRTGLGCILDFWYPRPFYPVQEALKLYFLFVFSVLYTKNVLSSTQFSGYNTNFFDHLTAFLKIG
jgi:hypothetical protein